MFSYCVWNRLFERKRKKDKFFYFLNSGNKHICIFNTIYQLSSIKWEDHIVTEGVRAPTFVLNYFHRINQIFALEFKLVYRQVNCNSFIGLAVKFFNILQGVAQKSAWCCGQI